MVIEGLDFIMKIEMLLCLCIFRLEIERKHDIYYSPKSSFTNIGICTIFSFILSVYKHIYLCVCVRLEGLCACKCVWLCICHSWFSVMGNKQDRLMFTLPGGFIIKDGNEIISLCIYTRRNVHTRVFLFSLKDFKP